VKNKEAWLTRNITFSFSRLDGMEYPLCLVVVRVGFVFQGASVRSYRSVSLGSRISSVRGWVGEKMLRVPHTYADESCTNERGESGVGWLAVIIEQVSISGEVQSDRLPVSAADAKNGILFKSSLELAGLGLGVVDLDSDRRRMNSCGLVGMITRAMALISCMLVRVIS
jgi:hypothetical protein